MKDYPPPKKKKKKKKVLDHYLHHDLGMLPLLRCFFSSFTHLTIPRSPPKFNQFFLAGPVHKISSQSVHNFLSNVVHRQTNKQANKQTDRQTNQRYQKHNLLCQGGNKPINKQLKMNTKPTLNTSCHTVYAIRIECYMYACLKKKRK